LYERLKILGLLRLDGGDDNVFTSLLAAPGFIKHAIRLACTGTKFEYSLSPICIAG
jgi:hypothetical protein